MKSLNSIMSKVLLVVFLLVIAPAGIHSVRAATIEEKQPVSSIHFICKEDGLLVFDVSFSFNTAGRFRIVDEYDAILFDEKVLPFPSIKRFKIEADGIRKLHFESITKESTQRKTFILAYQFEEKLKVTEVQ